MFEKYIVPAIGVGAFIIAGLAAKDKVEEMVVAAKEKVLD